MHSVVPYSNETEKKQFIFHHQNVDMIFKFYWAFSLTNHHKISENFRHSGDDCKWISKQLIWNVEHHLITVKIGRIVRCTLWKRCSGSSHTNNAWQFSGDRRGHFCRCWCYLHWSSFFHTFFFRCCSRCCWGRRCRSRWIQTFYSQRFAQ